MFVLYCRTGKGVFSAMKLGKTRISKDDHKKGGKYYWLLESWFYKIMQMYLFIGCERKTNWHVFMFAFWVNFVLKSQLYVYCTFITLTLIVL